MKVTNRTILHELKIRLNEAKDLWVEDLYSILWAYRMTPRIPMRELPFNLAYGTEVMILLEIELPSARVEQYNEPSNSECQRVNLDLLSEFRQQAQVRMAAHRQMIAQYYNAKVRSKVFRLGDLVLRKAEASKLLDQKKLSSN